MKAKFGMVVVAGSGKIGGHVASRNRAGSYFRTKVTPVNPNTPAQSAVRSRLAGLSIGWRGLTAAQRLQWNKAVENFSKTDVFGDLRNPSGFNLYQKLNNHLLSVGAAQITVPPAPVAVPSILTLVPTVAPAGAVSIAFTATPVPAGVKMIIRATPAISPGRAFVKSEFRRISAVAAAQASPYVATADYGVVFGAAGTVGNKVFFEAFHINITTGQAGIALQASAIIT